MGAGQRYRDKHLGGIDKNELLGNRRASFDFFISHVVEQAKNAESADKLRRTIKETVTEMLFNEGMKTGKWGLIHRRLKSRFGKWGKGKRRHKKNKPRNGKAGKQRDADMVTDSLEFVRTLRDQTLVKYSRDQVEAGRLLRHWTELKEEIRQIGPKTAAFYLRDVAMLYGLENKISKEDFECIQSVDTWVHKFVKERVGKVSLKEANSLVNEFCLKKEISPLVFNAGVWYRSTQENRVS